MRAASQFIAGVAPMTAPAAWSASGMGWALDDVAARAPVRAQRFAEVVGVDLVGGAVVQGEPGSRRAGSEPVADRRLLPVGDSSGLCTVGSSRYFPVLGRASSRTQKPRDTLVT